MNRKELALILLGIALLGGAGVVLIQHHKQAWTASESLVGGKLFPDFRFNDVALIQIKGRSTFSLVRKEGTWCVPERGDYPANYPQIKDLLLKLKDAKVVQSEDIGPSQVGRVELEAPGKGNGSATLFQFNDAQGKKVGALLVGRPHDRPQKESEPIGLHGFFDGRYVILPESPNHVLLISDELASAAPRPEFWLSRDFIKIEHLKSATLTSTNGAVLWTLSRQTESFPWTLADSKPGSGEMLDQRAASRIAEFIRFLDFVDVAPDSAATASAQGSERPVIVLAETFDRFFYTLKIGPKRADGSYLLRLDVKADIPSAHGPEDSEISEDEFQNKTKLLKEKVDKESRLADSKWAYLADPRLIEPLLIERASLLQHPDRPR